MTRFDPVKTDFYDKGDSSDLYHFHNESTRSPVVLEHFGDSRSARLEEIFEPLN